MTNVEALKALYEALGGTASDVADDNLTVEVLNAIAEKYEGDGDAELISEAIENIADAYHEEPSITVKTQPLKVSVVGGIGMKVRFMGLPNVNTDTVEVYRDSVLFPKNASTQTRDISILSTSHGGSTSYRFVSKITTDENIPTGKKLSITADLTGLEVVDVTNEAGSKYEGFIYFQNSSASETGVTITVDTIDA